MFVYGVVYGVVLVGVNVKIVGVVLIFMVVYYFKVKDIIGVMIIVFYNLYIDNGIKVIKLGYKMFDEEEFNLEIYIDDNEILFLFKLGVIEIIYDVEDIYINVYEDLNIFKILMKIIYDFVNGVNYFIFKKVIEFFVLYIY